MRKLLLLLTVLLTGASGAWAIDVTIANCPGYVANQSCDHSLPSAYGSFNGQTYTTNATSGLAGVTITASSGLTITESTVNVSNYGKCFSLTTAAASTNYTVTLAAPSGYVITGYSLEGSANSDGKKHTLTSADGSVSVTITAPPYQGNATKSFAVTGLETQSTHFTISTANQGNALYLPVFKITVVPEGSLIDVTYELYDDGAATPTETYVERVEKNSDVNIPASWLNYVSYSITPTGTIGETDCTITVNRTTRTKITDLSNLSNGKAYYIRNERGTWAIISSVMSASGTADYTVSDANKFVLYNTGEEYYLYSVSDGKFVRSDKSLSRTPEAITITATSDATYPWLFKFDDSHIFNGGNGFMIIDDWSTLDGGNKNAIIEAADFDYSIIDAMLSIEGEFATAIEQLRAINFGTGLGQYSFTGDYAAYTATASSVIDMLEGAGATEQNLTIAQDMLAHYTLNMPTAGFYRIKGATSGKYLASGLASNSKFNMTTAEDASTIFYYDGTKLVNYGSGKSNGVTTSAWAWVNESGASTVTFKDGLTNGGYAIQTATAHFYDDGDNNNSADRGGSIGDMSSANVRYRSWQLTAINTLPVTVSAAGYATLYSPVALTIPSGVKAYYVSALSETEATLTEIETTIPATTPVILQAAADNYDFATTTGGTDVSASNKLSGSLGGVAVSENESYTLQRSEDNTQTGFFPKSAGTIAGFKAYLLAGNIPSSPASIKGFTFKFEDGTATGISSIEGGQVIVNSDAIFNLAGQRMGKLQRGINIVNGKKLIVK